MKKNRPTHNPALPFVKQNWTGNVIDKRNQYINLDGASERTLKEVYKWQRQKNELKPLKRNQQAGVDVVKTNDFIKGRSNAITWLGHASFFITLDGKQIVTDPVFDKVGPLKRYTALPCAVKDFTGVDYILLSHNHRDHCDKKSMQQLCRQNPNAIILTGLEIGKLLQSWKIANTIIEAGWYQSYEQEMAITYLPARHWSRRGLNDMNQMLWGSFMIEGKDTTIYFGADSGLGTHFEEIPKLYKKIDYAILGIGAYKPEWFMGTSHTSPADALVAFKQLDAAYFIPMHHGTFDLSDEPVFYPKQQLQLLAEEQMLQLKVLHLTIGDRYKV
jgi:L-ascorbate metabolism protein UlaG (beta-lactamase superfamily)